MEKNTIPFNWQQARARLVRSSTSSMITLFPSTNKSPIPNSVAFTLAARLSSFHFYDEEILKVINAAHGHDEISLRMIKLFGVSIVEILSMIFKIGIDNGIQNEPFRGVLTKRCSENIEQIYRRTSMPQWDFNTIAFKLYWNRTSAWLFSCNFAAYFQNAFS